MKNLVVAVLGNRNSGKSSTWNELFERTVRTGSELKRLYLSNSEYVEVFLVSGSPEERGTYVGDIIGNQKPRIVLCSMQYRSDVTSTIDYFLNNGYMIYCHWLNPGFNDPNEIASIDSLGLSTYLLSTGALVGIRNAKKDVHPRVNEIKDFIYGWANSRRLIFKEEA
jgi:hypothetical protein